MKVKKKYKIKVGKSSRKKSEQIAFVVAESFLRSIQIGDMNKVLIAAERIEGEIYYLAYKNNLTCKIPKNEYWKDFRIQSTSKSGYSKNHDNVSKKIIQTLK